ncbi:hypothetical protein NGRA_0297 [Nosema granulosis]|uniref:Uncharacterized protein n=1 Tax=Nosema granulosis TaxID=83296 RepID=A0A9P6L064_9MICR|nr:hypothetical protein NGRA_0297 [Nosema granulosis]
MNFMIFWLIFVKNTDLNYNYVDSSIEDEWDNIGEFLNIKEQGKKQLHTQNKCDLKNHVDQPFIDLEVDYLDNIDQYCQDLELFNLGLNEMKKDIETDPTIDQNTKRKIDIKQNIEISCKRRKIPKQKQESKVDFIKLGSVVVRTPRALQKCKCVFDVIFTIYRNIEVFFNVDLQIEEIPKKIDTKTQAKYIFKNLEKTYKYLLIHLDTNSLLISNTIESISLYLDSMAQDISMRVSKHNSKDIDWNDIVDARYKRIFEKVEFKDLIILLIYQIKKTHKQIEEVKSVILQTFSTGFDGGDNTRDLILKTIILIKAGSITNHENQQDDFYFKINTVLKKNLIKYFWKNTVRLNVNHLNYLKEKFQGLPENELAVLPLKKDNLIFHLTYFRIKERIFENYVYPFICFDKKNIKSKRNICEAYSTLTFSMDLINKIADSLSTKTQIIQHKI